MASHDWSVQVATCTSWRMPLSRKPKPFLAGAMLSFSLPGPELNIQGQGVTLVVRSLPFSLMHQTRPSLSVDRMVPSLQALALARACGIGPVPASRSHWFPAT